jgi:transcriptional regulator with XRE-family HTH domain
MSEIKDILAKNLVKLRQAKKLTQSELAKQLNYSDKSISKWEHGDAVPPIEVLKEIADFYGVSLDFLVTEKIDEDFLKKLATDKNFTNKIIITLLAISFVWLIATFSFFYGYTLYDKYYWILFVGAVPVSVIVVQIFNSIWGKRKYSFIIYSLLIWTSLALLYLITLESNLWLLFILGVPLQIAIILWSQLKVSKKNRSN